MDESWARITPHCALCGWLEHSISCPLHPYWLIRPMQPLLLLTGTGV